MYIEDFLRKIEEETGKIPKKMNGGYSCCCPAHDDTNPSLSIANASDGKILLKCHAGCSADEICGALGLKTSDLFMNHSYLSKEEQIEYVYKNEEGKPLYKKVRTLDKKFYIHSVLDNGEWVRELRCDRRVLYHLPEVIAAREKGTPIFLVEGEKDADRLYREGLVATTPIEGAGCNLRAEYAMQLAGGNIVLLYDEDEAGYKRRDQWLSLLQKEEVQLRVVKLHGLEFQEKKGEDVSDWLQKGHTIKELLELVQNTQPKDLKNGVSKGLVAINVEEFLSREIPERKMLLSPIIPTQGLSLLYSKRGVGKTFLSLAIGLSVASGTSILRWKCEAPVPVLYVDGEMPAVLMQERIAKQVKGLANRLPQPSYFRLITPDLQQEGIPDISTTSGQQLLECVIGDAQLVILDNLSTLAPSLQENESDSWAPIQSWILSLRRRGISVLLVHHAGKNGRQRGTSRREDVLDSVIVLKHPEGYSPAEGAAFEVHIEKARGFCGKDAEPFIACLSVDQNGALSWAEKMVEDDLYDDVVEAIQSGTSIRKAAKEFDITKSKVEGIVKKAREQGDLPEK